MKFHNSKNDHLKADNANKMDNEKIDWLACNYEDFVDTTYVLPLPGVSFATLEKFYLCRLKIVKIMLFPLQMI